MIRVNNKRSKEKQEIVFQKKQTSNGKLKMSF